MNAVESKVLSKINMDSLLVALNELVRIQSLDGSEEELSVQEKMAEMMLALGMDVEKWDLDIEQLKEHIAFSAEVERPRAIGVVGKFGSGTGPVLILNGHTDVVPAGDLDNWSYPPWEATVNELEGRVYGRGALDMKGGLCCALFAIKAIIDAGVELDGQVQIHSVIGEEDGGTGTLGSIAAGYKGDAAIIMEPTELMIAPAQAGCFNFRITIPGKAAHGAVRFEGVDPLEKFLLIYQAILTYEQMRNANVEHPLFEAYPAPYPICVGTIRAGNWASTVAEELVFEGRYGIKVDEDMEDARSAFEDFISRTAQLDPWLRENPPKIEWWGGQFTPAEIPVEHPIVESTQEAFISVTGKAPTLQGMTYGADMHLLVNYGDTPTIMFGPGDVRKAHQPDEYVPLEDLHICTKTLALTVLRFCGIRNSLDPTEFRQDAGEL